MWTIDSLSNAFALYPLLPNANPATKFLVSLGLSAAGLDTFYDLASLVTGRDPLTGQHLTSRELFITWLALSLPLVSASQLRMVDDYVDFAGDVGYVARGDIDTSIGRHLMLHSAEVQSGKHIVNWSIMGTNDAGTVFIGSDNWVRGIDHVTEAMGQYGPGINIAGGHGYPTGEFSTYLKFYFDDLRDFNNPSNPYFGQVTVLNMNELLSSDSIKNLGGVGQIAYLNWCHSASCKIILEKLQSLSKP